MSRDTAQQGYDTAQQCATIRRRELRHARQRAWQGLCVAIQFLYRGQGDCDTTGLDGKFKFFKTKKKKKEMGKTVIYRNSPKKKWDFSRSRMTKQITPLESSREI